ncbi:MAG: hypothetical protein ACRD50_04405 [Candidatus Acidiferrales bacterium]
MKRFFIAVFALMFVLACALGIYFYRRHSANALFVSAPTPDVFALLPDDAPAYIFCDVARLRSSPVSAGLAALAQSNSTDAEYKTFVADTGFDFFRDVDRIAAAFWPGDKNPKLLAFAQGHFDAQKIKAYARRSGGKIREQDGREIYELSLRNPPAIVSFTFLASDRIAISQNRLLDFSSKSRTTPPPDASMREGLEKLSGAAFFAIARTAAWPQMNFAATPQTQQLGKLLASVQLVSLAGQPQGNDLGVAFDADCDSVAHALELSTLFDAVRWFARAALSDPRNIRSMSPEDVRLLNSVLAKAQVSRDSNHVVIRLNLSSDLLQGESPASNSGSAR